MTTTRTTDEGLSVAVMQKRALTHPLSPGGDVLPYRRVLRAGSRLIIACCTTEVCGCLGPVWHVSVSSQDRTGMLDDEKAAHDIARRILSEVGVPDRELWWWNAHAMVGHLRVHLTNGERLLMGSVVAELPDDHDEPGVWMDRAEGVDRG